jgi:hypothetical protein
MLLKKETGARVVVPLENKRFHGRKSKKDKQAGEMR